MCNLNLPPKALMTIGQFPELLKRTRRFVLLYGHWKGTEKSFCLKSVFRVKIDRVSSLIQWGYQSAMALSFCDWFGTSTHSCCVWQILGCSRTDAAAVLTSALPAPSHCCPPGWQNGLRQVDCILWFLAILIFYNFVWMQQSLTQHNCLGWISPAHHKPCPFRYMT